MKNPWIRFLGHLVAGSEAEEDLLPDTLPMVANEFYFEFRKFRIDTHNWRFYITLGSLALMLVFMALAIITKDARHHVPMVIFEVATLATFFASKGIADTRFIAEYNRAHSTHFQSKAEEEVDWIKKRLGITEADFLEYANKLYTLLELHRTLQPRSLGKALSAVFSTSSWLTMLGIFTGFFVAVQPQRAQLVWQIASAALASWSTVWVFLALLAVFLIVACKSVYRFLARIYLSRVPVRHISDTTLRELALVLCRNARG